MGRDNCTSCKEGTFKLDTWEVVKEYGDKQSSGRRSLTVLLCENYKCNKCGAESKRKRSK